MHADELSTVAAAPSTVLQVGQALALLMPVVIAGLGMLWKKLGAIDDRLQKIGERTARVETILEERTW